MIDANKAVFLPLNEKVTDLYAGYVLDGQLMKGLNETDIYTETVHFDVEASYSMFQKVIMITILFPFLFLFLLILLLALPFKKFDVVGDSIKRYNTIFWAFFFDKKKKKRIEKKRLPKYERIEKEDVPEFLDHCKEHQVRVYLYSYVTPSPEQQIKINSLIKNELICSFHFITRLSDLSTIIKVEKISLHNSLLLMNSIEDQEEAHLLGFTTENGRLRNVGLLKKRKFSSEGGKNEIEWNSSEIIVSYKNKIEYYLRSKSNRYFKNNTIIFIEDSHDVFLNNYIRDNLKNINMKLDLKGMRLIHFPSIKYTEIIDLAPVFSFIRYRFPFLYSIPDLELNEFVAELFQNTSPDHFYKFILEELELPYFKRPALLRSISDGYGDTHHKFTYKTIEYKTHDDLKSFFDWYVEQVKIPRAEVLFSRAPEPEEYDADWKFAKESGKLSEELKLKIDEIQKQGNVGVLAEVLLYMLDKLKDGNPALLKKIQPLLDSKQSVQKNAQLSHLSIDKNFKIVLTDFGNIEIKMHALPKAVFILFLRYPDGIRFKELYMYKNELLEIYNKLTNKSDKNEIERAINDLVDMTNPSINQKCARIREAFRNYLDEDIAKFYFISGANGEPKKIKLPRHLMTMHFK
jgi:hypothetical protein